MMQSMEENEHIISMPNIGDLEIDENYDFIPDSIGFKIMSSLLYIIAYPILYVYTKIFNGLKIVGIEKLKSIKGGKITVSNHIHFLDCVFVSLASFLNPIYFPTIQSNFKIPVISVIIKLFNAMPIPTNINAKKKFVNSIDKLLKNKKTVHFYPEASLWPYYKEIRNFKTGAFVFACKNNVPIVPMVYTYNNPTGFMKYIKKKPYITLNILEPVYPNGDSKEDINNLKEIVENNMKEYKTR